MDMVYVGAGGFLGAVFRCLIYRAFSVVNKGLPWGTLLVNILGSFILAYIYTFSVERLAWSDNVKLFLGVGLLGAFTTFSTFPLETLRLFQEGNYGLCATYFLGNVILSLAAAFFGMWLAL